MIFVPPSLSLSLSLADSEVCQPHLGKFLVLVAVDVDVVSVSLLLLLLLLLLMPFPAVSLLLLLLSSPHGIVLGLRVILAPGVVSVVRVF